VTQDYDKVWSFELSDGRYFTPSESTSGKGVAIIGSTIAENLFNGTEAVGQDIKVFGRKLEVIGLFKKEGSSSIGNSADDQIVIPINFARNVIDINFEGYNPMLIVKAKAGVSNDQLRDELTGIMRSIRRLKPGAEDNFAINETSLLTQGFESLFDIISIAGWVIGGFSLLVGGFGIANIMFVSVRERTNIIGIQKSLGAKNFFILFEFLFEAIILCLMGGVIGLLLVYVGTLIVSGAFDMELSLTLGNIMMGILVSAFIGLLAGVIPAWSASRMDPVVAIRASGS
jgi:putative ABC transport system permease protein